MRHLIIALIWICLLFSNSLAQFIILPTTDIDSSCGSPVLAADNGGYASLAFVITDEATGETEVAVQFFATEQTDFIVTPETHILAEGHSPAICWSWDGFRVAFLTTDSIVIYHQTGFDNWVHESSLSLPENSTVSSLEIAGASYHPSAPYVFLVAHAYSQNPEETNDVLYSSFDENGWAALVDLDLDPQMANPQLILHHNAYTPTPELYYTGGDALYDWHLKSCTLMADGWSEPYLVRDYSSTPSPIVNEFDIATSGEDIHILGLGAQPTCPCGSIFLHSYNSIIGTWSVDEQTVHYDHYDWPMSPKIAASEIGYNTYAFWYQLGSGNDMTALRKSLEFRVIENGIVSDEGDFLDEPGHGGPYGSKVAIAAGAWDTPVLAWTRLDSLNGEPLPERIWIAKKFNLSAVDEPEIVSPKIQLTAWPNPFNPQVKISFDANGSQQVRMDVFDARGRRVANLLDGAVAEGRSDITWNARTNSGRPLPSGVYFVRLSSDQGEKVLKVVLTE